MTGFEYCASTSRVITIAPMSAPGIAGFKLRFPRSTGRIHSRVEGCSFRTDSCRKWNS